ncbi:MAG: hypothetical protein HY246_02565 [Proteobacteria bacterium]|nr:hypothetical protein [Pseudomonadota bacterium]
MDFRLLYITAAGAEEARKIGCALVEAAIARVEAAARLHDALRGDAAGPRRRPGPIRPARKGEARRRAGPQHLT